MFLSVCEESSELYLSGLMSLAPPPQYDAISCALRLKSFGVRGLMVLGMMQTKR